MFGSVVGDAIISEVLIKNNRALITLKDIGSVYFKHSHQFPSKILKPPIKKEILDEFLSYKLEHFNRIPQFNIIQLTEQVDFPERLKEDPALYKTFKKRFVTGHYTPQLRWRSGVPWRHADIKQPLLELLREKKQREHILQETVTYAIQTLQQSSQAKKRRITRHEEYIAEHWNTLTMLDDQGLMEKQQAVEHERFALEQRVKALLGEGTVEVNPVDKSFDIVLDNIRTYIHPKQSLTADEIFTGRLYIMDIEKPLFDTPEDEVSWIAAILVDKGKVLKKTIKTLRDPGIGMLRDWTIERYATERDLVKSVEHDIISPDHGRTVDAVIAYNAPYDLENTEAAVDSDWKVGERAEDPKVEVGIDFFRKIRIPGRLVLDPLRWARIRYKDLPNRKLELILAEAHGIEHAKALNYDQLAELERVAKTCDVKHLHPDAAQILASWSGHPLDDLSRIPRLDQLCARLEAQYVSTDVDELFRMVFSQWARDHVEDAVWLSDAYGVELSRLLHSVNTINDTQERNYWTFVGTYRDIIYQKTTTMKRLQQKARTHLAERIKAKLLPEGTRYAGHHGDVAKVYLPIGLWLANLITGHNPETQQTRFPEVLKLKDYALQHRADKRRFFTLCQYLDAFASYILVDFGLYNLAVTDYHDMLERHQVDRKAFERYSHGRPTHPELVQKLAEHKIPEQEFCEFRMQYRSLLQEESEWAIKHFDRGTFTTKGIAKHPDIAAEFCVQHQLPITTLEELLRIAGKEFKGEQDIDPSLMKLSENHWQQLVDVYEKVRKRKRKIFGQYNVDADEIKMTLNQCLADFQAFCNRNGYWILHAQGGFVYLVHGDRGVLKAPDTPVILVDEIDRAYLCPNSADTKNHPAWQPREHKIYYRKHNYYEGLKVTNRPTHNLALFEMEWYQKIIDRILDRDYEAALFHANECLDILRGILDEKQADIAYWERQALPPQAAIDTTTYDAHLTIPKRDFLWLSKRRNMYRAYEHGELVHFLTEEAHAHGAKLQTDERTGRKYFEEPLRKDSENVRRVHIMPVEQFQPDVSMYYDRIKERVKDLIEPLCGEKSKAFVQRSQDDVTAFLRTDPFV